MPSSSSVGAAVEADEVVGERAAEPQGQRGRTGREVGRGDARRVRLRIRRERCVERVPRLRQRVELDVELVGVQHDRAQSATARRASIGHLARRTEPRRGRARSRGRTGGERRPEAGGSNRRSCAERRQDHVGWQRMRACRAADIQRFDADDRGSRRPTRRRVAAAGGRERPRGRRSRAARARRRGSCRGCRRAAISGPPPPSAPCMHEVERRARSAAS